VTAWQEFPWQEGEPDPRDRLCTSGGKRLDCRIEGATSVNAPAPPKDEIVVCAYNAERGFKLDDQVRVFAGGSVPAPDVILLSEADRYCTRTQSRNVAREYARALGMCYVYGAEFVELPRFFGPGGRIRRRCEHGNAILSRYPLGNVRLIRHTESRSWNSALQRILHVGEPRLGGRMALAADVRIGEKRLRVYSVHFESGGISEMVSSPDRYREAEARELIADAADVQHGVIVGGDMNVGGYIGVLKGERPSEPATAALFAAGYADAHASLPAEERITTDSGVVIDLVFGRGVRLVDAGVGRREVWGGLSDHLPVWARVRL
jgi:endonuclease/exonuclease/phosphatase family metal-dependent hydrolase